ncbi:hypothetical protein B0H21DRAFT_818146 [Amylocystis lapponica]|nr:hypothetical protein B0H21DRAFT_818146 [Amylocystis lapponica]
MVYVWVTLGGPHPGISAARPKVAVGNYEAPFPIIVRCHNREQAESVYNAHTLFDRANNAIQPSDRVLYEIARDVKGAHSVVNAFRDGTLFYVVVAGRQTGIFLEWDNGAEPEVKKYKGAKHIRRDNFEDALLYYMYKGSPPDLEPPEPPEDVGAWVEVEEARSSPHHHGNGDGSMLSRLEGLQLNPPQSPPIVRSPTTYRRSRHTLGSGSEPSSGSEPGSTPFTVAPMRVYPVSPNQSRLRSQRHDERLATPPPPPSPQTFSPRRDAPSATTTRLPPTRPLQPPRPTYIAEPPQPQPTQPTRQWIYQLERSVDGVQGHRYTQQRGPADNAIPTLGAIADHYLRAHGYVVDSRLLILQACYWSDSVESFVETLAPNGFVVAEMEFLWSIIDHNLFVAGTHASGSVAR